MKRVLAGLLAVVLTATGCGVRPSGVIPGLPAPSGPADLAPPSVYFVLKDRLVRVGLVRPGEDPVAVLAAGPDADGRAKGLSTQVPADAAPADETVLGPEVVVELHTDVARLTPLAVDQIVCTVLGQFPGASSATLHGGGHATDQRECPIGG